MIFEELAEVLDPEPHPAALNMAIDEILLRRASAPLLRTYLWSRPAVSFGYFGKFAGIEPAWRGRDWVRRWTGGGVVPHGEDFTYTLVVPRGPFFALGAVESYQKIHAAVAAALGRVLGAVSLAPTGGAKVSEACFENAVLHDILADGRKIAGAAQRRTQYGLLHQGSIQIGAVRGISAQLKTELGRALAGRVMPRRLTAEELAGATVLAAEKYAAPEWLRRF